MSHSVRQVYPVRQPYQVRQVYHIMLENYILLDNSIRSNYKSLQFVTHRAKEDLRTYADTVAPDPRSLI